ncbi:MAG: hypothetical protein IT581_08690 [Verrucomicrobiales bacterium]|nr:hypothetical protein [Verrucomicrobiales bacterium]
MKRPQDTPRVLVGDLRTRLKHALEPRPVPSQPSLALPADWPPTGTSVEFLVYEYEPLPTGRVAFQVRGPVRRIVFPSASEAPAVEAVASARDLGIEQESATSQASADWAVAEQALLDVMSGQRTAQEASGELIGYLHWLERHPALGADLRVRKQAFFEWLERNRRRRKL